MLPLSPGDELSVKIKHVGMRNGNIIVKVATSSSTDDKVFDGSAEVQLYTFSLGRVPIDSVMLKTPRLVTSVKKSCY